MAMRLKSFGLLSKQRASPTPLRHIFLVKNIKNSLRYFYSLPSVILRTLLLNLYYFSTFLMRKWKYFYILTKWPPLTSVASK